MDSGLTKKILHYAVATVIIESIDILNKSDEYSDVYRQMKTLRKSNDYDIDLLDSLSSSDIAEINTQAEELLSNTLVNIDVDSLIKEKAVSILNKAS